MTALDKGLLFPTQDDNGGVIQYYNIQSGKTLPLCAKPGCSHKDESCPAYYPERTAAPCILSNDLYVFTYDENKTELRLMCSAVDGTERGQVAKLQASKFDADSLLVSSAFYWQNKIYYILTVDKWSEEGDEESAYLIQTDLRTGSSESLKTVRNGDLIVGVYDKYLILSLGGELSPLMSESEYFYKNGAGADWDKYYEDWFSKNATVSYAILDSDTGEETTVSTVVGDTPETDADCNASDGFLYYTVGNELHAIDIANGEDRTLISGENQKSIECTTDSTVIMLELDESREERIDMLVYDKKTKKTAHLKEDFLGNSGWVRRRAGDYLVGTRMSALNIGQDFVIPINSFVEGSNKGQKVFRTQIGEK